MIHALVCMKWLIGIYEKLLPLCRRTALRLLLDVSIKSICSVSTYSKPMDLINIPMMTYSGSWETVCSLSWSRYQKNVVPGANRCFSLWCEPSSRVNSFESFRFCVRLLSSACVKGRPLLACILYPQQQLSCHYVRNQSYIPCYHLLQDQEGLDHEGIGLIAEGSSCYWT